MKARFAVGLVMVPLIAGAVLVKEPRLEPRNDDPTELLVASIKNLCERLRRVHGDTYCGPTTPPIQPEPDQP